VQDEEEAKDEAEEVEEGEITAEAKAAKDAKEAAKVRVWQQQGGRRLPHVLCMLCCLHVIEGNGVCTG
jgi:hypothetical protein